MAERNILKYRKWTEGELKAEGFMYHEPVRRVVLARRLPPAEAPRTIKSDWDTLVAGAGYFICFDGGTERKPDLYDYSHWPVREDHFRDLYQPWGDTPWQPTATQQHLLRLGCHPYTRRAGVWAKRLASPLLVQSVESPKPVEVPAGAWLCIAAQGSALGSPYSMDDAAFRTRYVV